MSNAIMTTPMPAGTLSDGACPHRRLLLVDPDAATLETVRRALCATDPPQWSIDFVASGVEGCAQLAAMPPDAPGYDLALIDCRPGLRAGAEIARDFLKLDAALWAVLATDTSTLSPELFTLEPAHGSRIFTLQKPFLPDELRQLARLCTETRSARRASTPPSSLEPEPTVSPAIQLERLLGELLAGPKVTRHAMLNIHIDRLQQYAEAECQSAAAERARTIWAALAARLAIHAHRSFRIDLDESAVVLFDCPASAAMDIAQDLAAGAHATGIERPGASADLSLSIGFVSIEPGHGVARDVGLAALVARRKAYARGGNTVAEGHLNDTSVIRVLADARTVPEIEYALENDRFEFWAQPIVPLSIGVRPRPSLEILLRMRDRTNALWGPDRFLPVAEQNGLASRIDRLVLRRTLDLLARKSVRSQVDYLSVNVSAYTLSDKVGLSWMEETLLAAGSSVESLCVEITESAALQRADSVRDFVIRMRAIGVRFALDDFGAGFSTFDYLQSLPAHYLKIDGSLVRGCAADPRRLAFLERINEIGHLWNKRTIAEHVEDLETLTAVRSAGIDYAQGYVIARPAPFAMAMSSLNEMPGAAARARLPSTSAPF